MPVAQAPSDPVGAPAVPGTETPGTRNQRSVTFERSDGKQVTRVYAGSVNYQDARGQWQSIDNRLSESGGVIRNGANRYSAQTVGHPAQRSRLSPPFSGRRRRALSERSWRARRCRLAARPTRPLDPMKGRVSARLA
jgi:hypothetical protein